MLGIASILLVVTAYETVPTHNCQRMHFDAIIVLGTPALRNGEPSPEERARVMEGVKEFEAGRAGHLIFTGGATEKNFVEGDVMAKLAEQEGVPSQDVVIDRKARNTIQNIFFSHEIMEQRGWTSAEVVSSPSHLPRTELILEHYGFKWRTQASQWPPEFGWTQIGMNYLPEAMYTLELRWRGFPPSPYMPEKPTS
jgi:uncharacterized SAM-binding protein YcdF (DUF218 family)